MRQQKQTFEILIQSWESNYRNILGKVFSTRNKIIKAFDLFKPSNKLHNATLNLWICYMLKLHEYIIEFQKMHSKFKYKDVNSHITILFITHRHELSDVDGILISLDTEFYSLCIIAITKDVLC